MQNQPPKRRPRRPTPWAAACLPLLAAACLCPSPALAQGPASSSADVVHVQVEHTLFHPLDEITLEVERLDGRMVAAAPGRIISLDDVHSYSLHIDRGVTRLSAENLSRLLNSYLLRQADSSVRRVEVSFDGQQVVIRGEVHKLLTLPFEGRGQLSATPAGELRLHVESFHVAGVLSKELLSFFGIHLDTVAASRRPGTFRVEGDDFIAPLSAVFPAPRVYGRVARVHIEGQVLIQDIGAVARHHATQSIPKLLSSPANYIYFTGGRMQFGKVTMNNVDLTLLDRTPNDPFDFSLAHYQQQIQAGYVKVLPSLGLLVYAVDYSKLRAKAAPAGPPAH